MRAVALVTTILFVVAVSVAAVDVFEPTWDWQEISPGQSIPGGLEVRINMETGTKEARRIKNKVGYIPKSEREELQVIEQQKSTVPSAPTVQSASAETVAAAAVQEALRSTSAKIPPTQGRPQPIRIQVIDDD